MNKLKMLCISHNVPDYEINVIRIEEIERIAMEETSAEDDTEVKKKSIPSKLFSWVSGKHLPHHDKHSESTLDQVIRGTEEGSFIADPRLQDNGIEMKAPEDVL
jgi:hypothetical protein